MLQRCSILTPLHVCFLLLLLSLALAAPFDDSGEGAHSTSDQFYVRESTNNTNNLGPQDTPEIPAGLETIALPRHVHGLLENAGESSSNVEVGREGKLFPSQLAAQVAPLLEQLILPKIEALVQTGTKLAKEVAPLVEPLILPKLFAIVRAAMQEAIKDIKREMEAMKAYMMELKDKMLAKAMEILKVVTAKVKAKLREVKIDAKDWLVEKIFDGKKEAKNYMQNFAAEKIHEAFTLGKNFAIEKITELKDGFKKGVQTVIDDFKSLINKVTNKIGSRFQLMELLESSSSASGHQSPSRGSSPSGGLSSSHRSSLNAALSGTSSSGFQSASRASSSSILN